MQIRVDIQVAPVTNACVVFIASHNLTRRSSVRKPLGASIWYVAIRSPELPISIAACLQYCCPARLANQGIGFLLGGFACEDISDLLLTTKSSTEIYALDGMILLNAPVA
jgi:hypothetical protein